MSNHTNIQSSKSTTAATTVPAAVKDVVPVNEHLKNETDSQSFQNLSIQCKLAIGSPNDPLEHEADAMADKVMRMPEQAFIQRKCTDCKENEKLQRKPLASFIQKKGAQGVMVASKTVSNQIISSRGKGSGIPKSTKSFMESRFGADFSNVNIHTGEEAVQMNRELGAKAFTVGDDIYFNEGKYNPRSNEGKHLLAHELTHVVQQGGQIQRRLQRSISEGNDNYASYVFDDSACSFDYRQHWYFRFNVQNLSTVERTALMESAARHIQAQWSGIFPLLPYQGGTSASTSCPCTENGVVVNVNITPHAGEKTGRGIQVEVQPSVRANVNPVTGNTELEHNPTSSDFRGNTYESGLQYTVAHEFGHTIDITDEYPWISRLFTPVYATDTASMMNSGNEVRTRHYQYFGDLLSMAIPGCRYNPNGVREPEYENPVFRTSTLDGITTSQDGLAFPGPTSDFGSGATFDRRVSTERVLGLFYPQVGAIRLTNPDARNAPSIGVTGGLRLGQIAHPLVFNLRSGVVFNPDNPDNPVSIPLNIQAGLRTSQFEFGVQYTPVFNILDPTQITHLFGASLSISLP